MSLVRRLLFAGPAWSTHHRLALDAVSCLQAPAWQRLFLRHHERLLAGATTPNDDFQDYKNHVLCVRDACWGGAPAAARAWYLRTVYALRDRLWPEAAYAAGILSHYVVDPFTPMHANQTETGTAAHRGVEWAVMHSYRRLRRMLLTDLGGYPQVDVPAGKDWLERMIRSGAEQGHACADLIIDHFDPSLVVRWPQAAIDDEACKALAKLLGLATATCARILDRAIEESKVDAPKTSLVGTGLGLFVRSPAAWLDGMSDRGRQRRQLKFMLREFQKTGKVTRHLPPAHREVRRMHAVEVRRIAVEDLDKEAVRPIGAKHLRSVLAQAATAKTVLMPAAPNSVSRDEGPRAEVPRIEKHPEPPLPQPLHPIGPTLETKVGAPAASPALKMLAPAPPAPVSRATTSPSAPALAPAGDAPAANLRFRVNMSSPIDEAPGVTPEFASLLAQIGTETVGDLLIVDPNVVVKELKSPAITAEKVMDWQTAAALACQLPEIRAQDLMLLVAAGIGDPKQLARFTPKELLDRLQPFLRSDSADLIRLDPPPTLHHASQWIDLARQARPLSAAA